MQDSSDIVGIYKITSPVGGIYIGKSVNIPNRQSAYKNLQCESQPLIYESLMVHGYKSHLFEVVEYCSAEDLNFIEAYYIAYFDTYNSPHGLNSNGNYLSILKTHNADIDNKNDCVSILKYYALVEISTTQSRYAISDALYKFKNLGRSILFTRKFNMKTNNKYNAVKLAIEWAQSNGYYIGEINNASGVVAISRDINKINSFNLLNEFDLSNNIDGILCSDDFVFGSQSEVIIYEKTCNDYIFPHIYFISDNNVKVSELPTAIKKLMISFSTESQYDKKRIISNKIYSKMEYFLTECQMNKEDYKYKILY